MRTVDELLDESIPEYDYDAISNELHEILDDTIERRVLHEMSIGNNSTSIFIFSARGLVFNTDVRSSIINDILIGVKPLNNEAIVTDARNSFLNELKHRYGYKKANITRIATNVFLELEWQYE